MKRSHLVYAAVNIVQLSAAFTAWSLHHDPAQAQAAAGWSWPLAGTAVVDRPFQLPTSQWGAGHRGVDLRGEPGGAVLAAGAGTVAYSGLLAGKGVVVVKHADGLRTTYEPVTDGPPVGASVDVGEKIGRLAGGHASCRAGTTCLHWGLLRGETYLDPLRLVLRGKLRLLPLSEGDRPGAAPPRAAVAQEGVRVATTQERDPLASTPARPGPPSARQQFLNGTVNLATAAVLGYGLFAGARRSWRFLRSRRG